MKRYEATIRGENGIWSALRSLFGSRYTGIKTIVQIPSTGDVVTLDVQYDAAHSVDRATLTYLTAAGDRQVCEFTKTGMHLQPSKFPPRQRE